MNSSLLRSIDTYDSDDIVYCVKEYNNGLKLPWSNQKYVNIIQEIDFINRKCLRIHPKKLGNITIADILIMLGREPECFKHLITSVYGDPINDYQRSYFDIKVIFIGRLPDTVWKVKSLESYNKLILDIKNIYGNKYNHLLLSYDELSGVYIPHR